MSTEDPTRYERAVNEQIEELRDLLQASQHRVKELENSVRKFESEVVDDELVSILVSEMWVKTDQTEEAVVEILRGTVVKLISAEMENARLRTEIKNADRKVLAAMSSARGAWDHNQKMAGGLRPLEAWILSRFNWSQEIGELMPTLADHIRDIATPEMDQ